MASPYLTEARPQALQGAVQIHLEGSPAASGRRRRIGQRALLQDQELDRLALPQRQVRDGGAEPLGGLRTVVARRLAADSSAWRS